MESPLVRAYCTIFDQHPETPLEEWQLAQLVLDNFEVAKLGESLAKKSILQIVNHVAFPNQELTTLIVGRAEGFASELWDDLSTEPHMAELEYKEFQGE